MDTGRVRRPRKPKTEVVETVLTVRASGAGVDEEKREALQVTAFEVEPAYVRVSAGVTKSTGNYESLRVDVGITMPCYAEEVQQVAKQVGEMVSEILDEEVDAYTGG